MINNKQETFAFSEVPVLCAALTGFSLATSFNCFSAVLAGKKEEESAMSRHFHSTADLADLVNGT